MPRSPKPECRLGREIDAILFDFGGVFTPSPFAAVESMGRELGLGPGELFEIVFGSYHVDTDHPWHRLERGEISLAKARDEILELGARRGVDADPFKLFARMGGGDGTRQALVDRTLALRGRGYRTALITNNAREFRPRWMELVPTSEMFEVIVDSSEVGIRKPDPRIFELTLERLSGIEPTRTLFLDDYQANLDAAARLGIRGVLVEEDPAAAVAALDDLIALRRPSR